MRTIAILLFFGLLHAFVLAGEPAPDYNQYWPHWRGPLATGAAPFGNPPVEWSEDKNIRWKIELPGAGHATPVIWKDHIFILTAVATEQPGDSQKIAAARDRQPPWMRRRGVQPSYVQEFAILAIHREDGRVVWQRVLRQELPHEGTHPTASWASNSAVTDGDVVFAYFGSRGLFCLNLQGKLLWQTDLGDMTTRNGFGEGSSPALYGEVVVVNWDHEGQSFIVALDKQSGRQLWKKDRDEVTSWSSPIIVEVDGSPQVVINATGRTRGYDLATGEVVWEVGGMTVNTIPSPVHRDGLVFVTSGFRGSMLQAIRLAGAKGDLSTSASLVWQHERDTPYVPSPLLYGDFLYFVKVNKGVLSCFSASRGQPYYGPERLDGIANIYASPVGAAGRVYLTGRAGTTVVLEQDPEFKVLATNTLEDDFDASPAIVGNELYLRGHRALYCVAAE